MKKRVGILTSGGDCPGLNATIRGVAKALYARMGDSVEIVGILNGYHGLITGDYKEMTEDDFRGILTLGGTILGTKRTPFKLMRIVEEDKIDKVAAMKKTYKDAKLDCLLCLGGNGTHKTANLLSQEGLNIIGLPKTIDNDIYGTDVTFGFHTAVDIATDVIDRIHTTAGSHSRVMCIEIMGNKAGWLTLYSGIAGGADIILLPEMPYDIDRVCGAVERRAKKGSNFSIIAVAEGALNEEEAFKLMRIVEEDKIDKVAAMKKTYKDAKLDCLLCLGGNGTHKTANLLSQEGLNIIGLPKTIDNDIYGTDVTFGFHTAVDIATDVIDRIHTTAGSHSRVMCIEIMGNKAGWLTLYSGIAGGADIILLPEMPYDIDRVCGAVERRAKKGSNFSIIAVAEGALNEEEAKLKRKEWTAKRAEAGYTTATSRIAAAVQKKTGMETRVCIPGHMQRGGSPSAYDRVLATQFGSYAAKLVEIERYGVTVALVNGHVTANRLEDIAGKTRNVPEGCELLTVARRMGVSLG